MARASSSGLGTVNNKRKVYMKMITASMKKVAFILMQSLILASVLLPISKGIAAHNHQAMMKADAAINCDKISVVCAKTVTAAYAPNGDLWRLWSQKNSLYYQISKAQILNVQISSEQGQSFSAIKRVDIPKEKISSRGENRPKIAFDNSNVVYLSWAMPRERKYTADVRFSYSSDYGKTFTAPITINDDKLLAGHSFNELLVTPEGDINIVWLDSRFSTALKKQGKETNGSALFLAKGNMKKQQTDFTNKMLTNGTCVCCRIAMNTNTKGELAILWRHIYGDNIREFALLTLNHEEQPAEPIQISHDYWQINGCPHQGGGIGIDNNNRYHLVWFNQGDKGKGIFYAYSDDQGQHLSTPLSVGDFAKQAAHPHVSVQGNNVDIVWTQFNGVEHQLMHQKSTDSGKTFHQATQLAVAINGADRPFILTYKGKNYVSWQRPKQGHWLQAL